MPENCPGIEVSRLYIHIYTLYIFVLVDLSCIYLFFYNIKVNMNGVKFKQGCQVTDIT